MFFELNNVTIKQLSLFIILVIFMSCITIITYDLDKDSKTFDVSEKLSNNDAVDAVYEMLVFQYNIADNKFKDRHMKINYNDKIAMLFVFLTNSNVDKIINKSNLMTISEIDLIQDTILLFIHNKDGKKQLL